MSLCSFFIPLQMQVKMYILREGDTWEDQGTGFARLEDAVRCRNTFVLSQPPPLGPICPSTVSSTVSSDPHAHSPSYRHFIPSQAPNLSSPSKNSVGNGALAPLPLLTLEPATGPAPNLAPDAAQARAGVTDSHAASTSRPSPALSGPSSPGAVARECALRWIVVDAEERPGTELLRHSILREAVYELQGGGSIISWPDPQIGTSVALSFQDSMGCIAVWDHIRDVQQRLHGYQESPRNRRADDFGREGDFDLSDPSGSLGPAPARPLEGALVPLEVPTPSLSTLPVLAEIFRSLPDNLPRDPVMHPTFLSSLLDTFSTAEDLEDLPSLHHCCTIIKGMIATNDPVLIEVLFKEDHVLRVLGCLEYDPAHPARAHHREFLEKRVSFKEVVPLRDPALQARIHQTYQIGYVKDVVLASSLDEGTFSTLTSLIYVNNMEVMEALLKDQDFLLALFQRLREKAPTSPEGRDLVAFLQEFCTLAKHLDAAQQNQLFARLVNQGVFDVITDIFRAAERSPDLMLRAADVLLMIAAHDTWVVRKYLLRTATEAPDPRGELLHLLVRALLQPTEESAPPPQPPLPLPSSPHEPLPREGAMVGGDDKENDGDADAGKEGLPPSGAGSGLPEQVVEVLRRLLSMEASAIPSQTRDLEAFLKVVYEQGVMDALVEAVATSAVPDFPPGNPLRGLPLAPSVLGLLVEVLSYCVQQHGFQMRYYELKKGVLEKVVRLLQRRERWLQVAAVRFARTCIGMHSATPTANGQKDIFYPSQVIKQNLMDPLIAAFLANGDRNNLLNSTLLDLFVYITVQPVKQLVLHVGDRHLRRLPEAEYTDVLRNLRARYEQIKEYEANGGPPGGPEGAAPRTEDVAREQLRAARRRLDARALEREEEDYFNTDEDDEDEGPGRPPGPGGIFGLAMRPLGVQAAPHAPTSPMPSFDGRFRGIRAGGFHGDLDLPLAGTPRAFGARARPITVSEAALQSIVQGAKGALSARGQEPPGRSGLDALMDYGEEDDRAAPGAATTSGAALGTSAYLEFLHSEFPPAEDSMRAMQQAEAVERTNGGGAAHKRPMEAGGGAPAEAPAVGGYGGGGVGTSPAVKKARVDDGSEAQAQQPQQQQPQLQPQLQPQPITANPNGS